MEKKQVIILSIIGGVFAYIVIALIVGISFYKKSDKSLAEALGLGKKHVIEKKYDEAVAEFNEAIEDDPKDADAYLAMADVYVAAKEYDNAVATLENGYKATKEDGENKQILRKLKKCASRYIESLEGEERQKEIERLAEEYQISLDSAKIAKKTGEAENAGNAQPDENAAQTEEIAGLSKEEAAAEDARLLRIIEDEGSDLRGLLDGFVYDEHDNSLLQGDSEAVRDFLYGGTGGHSYIQQNQPANRPDIGADVQQWWYFLTKEQIEYLIYSICGKRVDFDVSIWASDSVYGQYFGFGGGIGDRIEYDSLEQFSVERVDADTWKVRATDIYNKYYGPSYVKSNVCFTVIRNPESCFDGYSLANFEENLLDKSWAKIYYDYLTKDPEGIDIMESYGGEYWSGGGYGWYLIYADEDAIPELYLTGEYSAVGDVLLYISQGRVMCGGFTQYGGRYIPRSGWFLNDGAHQGYEWGSISKLENGVLQEKGNWEFGDEYPDDNIVEQPLTHYLDGKQVSEAQYNEFVRNSTGGMEFQDCIGGYSMGESCLYFLDEVIRRN